MLHRLSTRAQLNFYGQALPTLVVIFIVAAGIASVRLLPASWALLVISATLATGLGIAIATRRKLEASIQHLVADLCAAGDWRDLGTVISVLASRLPSNASRDLPQIKLLFQGLQRLQLPPKLSWSQRRQLIWLVHAIHSIEPAAFSIGVETVVRLERHLPSSTFIRRDLAALARLDSRVQELL